MSHVRPWGAKWRPGGGSPTACLPAGFNGREGLVLYDLGYTDGDQGGRRRPVMHRGSIGEMCVPYGDPRCGPAGVNF